MKKGYFLILLTCTAVIFSSQLFAQTTSTKQQTSLICGETLITLICGHAPNFQNSKERRCNSNKLIFKNKSTKKTIEAKLTKTALKIQATFTGMKCSSATDARDYIQVEISRGHDCLICGYYIDIFDGNGQRLTQDGKIINGDFKWEFIIKDDLKFNEVENIERH